MPFAKYTFLLTPFDRHIKSILEAKNFDWGIWPTNRRLPSRNKIIKSIETLVFRFYWFDKTEVLA